MNMHPDDFWDMLPRDFFFKQAGYSEKIEDQERLEWERLRWQTAYLLNVHMKKGKTLKATDLISFPWEKQKKSKTMAERLRDKKRAEYIAKLYGSKIRPKDE